jgi:hypothetical protein
MGFSLRNLSVLAYANGFTLWHYKGAADTQASIAEPGYFDAAGDMLASGDMVMISARDGGRMCCVFAGADGLRLAAMG